ncbi:DHH family phosphoesterase [Alkalibacterium kapii]|uniref:Oligoribonuclease n=1 Tax=Alkalibacterium kapii TaxID=426704 RepID=A0A511ATC7_9LACT|nr:bifunctional oligoribonuclease/PAP phosphatase NrnA [Alkalibacterium kapii]GEK91459.1 oligoribonuclease [Alkalibacterium kapii]
MKLKSENIHDYDMKKDIWDIIKKWDTIIIHRHVRPDPDAIGSQCGLKEIIKATFPEKTVYAAGTSVDHLNYLDTMDKVERDLYDQALVIVTDTANIERIDGQLYKMAKQWIKIDHHPLDDPYGEVEWVNTRASSCSEMIADLWLTFPDEIEMTEKAARLLYAGMVGDTNRFLYDNVTPYTMKTAGELMTFNFSHTELNNKMNEIEPQTGKLMGYVLENFTLSEKGLLHIILTRDILKSLGIEDGDTHPIVPFLGNIAGVRMWVVFVEQPEGTYRVRLRSKEVVINKIATEHNGGGHPLASGARAKNNEEINLILEKLTKALNK